LLFSLVFLAVFALYAATVAPGVGPGHDSGELTTACFFLGVAHPPGYPLYVRLGHLWGKLLRWGDYAWRINLFSAFCGALAAALLAQGVARSTGSRLAGALAGLGFAGLTTVWRQCVVAEVFALHLALLAALAWLAWEVVQRAEEGKAFGPWTYAFYAVLGLALAHHHTFVLTLPAFLWLAVFRARPGWRAILLHPGWLLMLVVALALYVDMMLRARQGPPLNWGAPTTWGLLRDHFLRKAYGTFQLTSRVEPLEQGLAHGFGYLVFTYVRQAPWPWMLLATWGALRGWRSDRAVWGMALLWLLAMGPLFALIGRQKPDAFHLDLLERFYAGSYLGLAVLVGLGTKDVQRRWPRLALGLLLLIPWQWSSNLDHCSLRGRELASSYARTVLEGCPPGALLVGQGDLTVGALEYVQKVEGVRPDVEMICPGLLNSAWYRGTLSPRARAWLPPLPSSDVDRHRLLARRAWDTGAPVIFTMPGAMEGAFVPAQLAWRWYPAGLAPGAASQREQARQHLGRLLQNCAGLEYGLQGEERFWPRYLISARMALLRRLAGKLYLQQPRLAWMALQQLLDLGSRDPLDRLNRGLVLQQLGRNREALRDFDWLLQRHPSWELARQARQLSRQRLQLDP